METVELKSDRRGHVFIRDAGQRELPHDQIVTREQNGSGEMTQSDELGRLAAFAPEHIETTARLFLNLVVVPLLMRALFEKDIEVLRAEIGTHVAQSIAFFLAACRNGGVS